ncbi:MAG TPA: zinc ribbon domain-containing protein [Rhizomicrobium sp.]|nr:zinc ribbon domain-containing protein [Rhizomicrobium sp.]
MAATFHCPNCGRALKRGAQADILRDRQISFIGHGQPVKTVRCPGCGYEITCERILAGDHDSSFTATGIWVAILIGATIALAVWYFGDEEWWQGAILGFLAGALIGRFWSYLELQRQSQ